MYVWKSIVFAIFVLLTKWINGFLTALELIIYLTSVQKQEEKRVREIANRLEVGGDLGPTSVGWRVTFNGYSNNFTGYFAQHLSL